MSVLCSNYAIKVTLNIRKFLITGLRLELGPSKEEEIERKKWDIEKSKKKLRQHEVDIK